MMKILDDLGGYLSKAWRALSPFEEARKEDSEVSVEGKTRGQYKGHSLEIVHQFFPWPTAERHSLEIVEGIIHAIESKKGNRSYDSSIADRLFYINYLNINRSGDEHVNSVALMKLNDTHPDAFFGITLSKQSSFYRNQDYRQWEGAELFGHEMKRHLMNGSSFSLHGREHCTDGGFFFPGAHGFWEPVLDRIIQSAVKRFTTVRAADQQQIRGAYQEYVYSLIRDYIEFWLAVEEVKKGIDKPNIISLHSYRDGEALTQAEKAKFKLSHDPEGYPEEEVDRDRFPQTYHLLRFVTPAEYHQDLIGVAKQLEVEDIQREIIPNYFS